MANLNKVFLIGNLTRDPELRYTPSGSAVTEFGLAVSRQFTDSSGERRENTCFVDIQMWGRQAEVANEYLRKGRQLFVEGRLDFSSWENQEGQKRSKLRVVAENFQFLGSREGGDRGGAPERTEFQDRESYDDRPRAPVESPRPRRTDSDPPDTGEPDEDFNLGEVPF